MTRVLQLIAAADAGAECGRMVNSKPKAERLVACAELLEDFNPRGLTAEQLQRRFEALADNDHRSVKMHEGKVYYFDCITTTDDAFPYTVLPVPDEQHASIIADVNKIERRRERHATNAVSDVMARASKMTH